MIAGTNVLYNIGLPLLGAVFGVTLARVSLSTLVLGVAPSEDKPRHHMALRAAPPQPCEVGDNALSTFTSEETEAAQEEVILPQPGPTASSGRPEP